MVNRPLVNVSLAMLRLGKKVGVKIDEENDLESWVRDSRSNQDEGCLQHDLHWGSMRVELKKAFFFFCNSGSLERLWSEENLSIK